MMFYSGRGLYIYISNFKTSQHKETQIHQKKMQWSSLRCEITTMFHAILIFPTSAELNEFGYESWEARQLNIFCTLIKTKLNVKTEVISKSSKTCLILRRKQVIFVRIL